MQGAATRVSLVVPREAAPFPIERYVVPIAAHDHQVVEWRAGDVALIPGRAKLVGIIRPIGQEQGDFEISGCRADRSPAAGVSPVYLLRQAVAPHPQYAERQAQQQR